MTLAVGDQVILTNGDFAGTPGVIERVSEYDGETYYSVEYEATDTGLYEGDRLVAECRPRWGITVRLCVFTGADGVRPANG